MYIHGLKYTLPSLIVVFLIVAPHIAQACLGITKDGKNLMLLHLDKVERADTQTTYTFHILQELKGKALAEKLIYTSLGTSCDLAFGGSGNKFWLIAGDVVDTRRCPTCGDTVELVTGLDYFQPSKTSFRTLEEARAYIQEYYANSESDTPEKSNIKPNLNVTQENTGSKDDMSAYKMYEKELGGGLRMIVFDVKTLNYDDDGHAQDIRNPKADPEKPKRNPVSESGDLNERRNADYDNNSNSVENLSAQNQTQEDKEKIYLTISLLTNR